MAHFLLFIYILKINYFNLNDFYFIGMNSNAKGTNFTKVGVLLLTVANHKLVEGCFNSRNFTRNFFGLKALNIE